MGPEHTGVAGGVGVLAEADPVLRGELLGDGLDVFRSQRHQIFETLLTGHSTQTLVSVTKDRSLLSVFTQSGCVSYLAVFPGLVPGEGLRLSEEVLLCSAAGQRQS